MRSINFNPPSFHKWKSRFAFISARDEMESTVLFVAIFKEVWSIDSCEKDPKLGTGINFSSFPCVFLVGFESIRNAESQTIRSTKRRPAQKHIQKKITCGEVSELKGALLKSVEECEQLFDSLKTFSPDFDSSFQGPLVATEERLRLFRYFLARVTICPFNRGSFDYL